MTSHPLPAPAHTPRSTSALERASLVRRGLRLNQLSLAYNVVEAIVSLGAGIASGSIALTGFGIDSVIEVAATAAARWRLLADHDSERRPRVEQRARYIMGTSFIALAGYVTYDAVAALIRHARADDSAIGLTLLLVSAIAMPFVARAKRDVARALASDVLDDDATQTSLCAWLSATALTGVALNMAFGWWWADAAAALVMVPIIAREGTEAFRGRSCCDDHGCGPDA